MNEPVDPSSTVTSPDPDSIRRLLVALGEWGAAEVQGVSEPVLDELEDRALDAYKDVASVA